MIPVRRTADLPRWILARPFLLVPVLRWWNVHQRHRALLPIGLASFIAAAVCLTAPVVGHVLEAVAQSPATPFGSLAAACAIATARRRAHIHRGRVDSWLAALPAPSSVLLRALFWPVVQLLALSTAILIPFLSGTLSRSGAITLWLVVGAAYAVGSTVGWLSLSRDGRAASAPDFHYVSIRRPRVDWAKAPGLDPLSYWAVGQARAFAKPKVAAHAMLLVLLAIPLGMPGEKALAVAAAVWVLLYVGSLVLASVRVAFWAARWLAATNISYGRYTAAVGYRALLAQLWTWSWILFLTYAVGLKAVFRPGLRLAVACLLLSCLAVAVAARVAMRSEGMRSS